MAAEEVEQEVTEEGGEEDKPKGKSKKSLMLIIVALIVLGGGGTAFFMLRGHAAEPTAENGKGLIVFDPFIVNLADSGGSRFLRVNLQLVVAEESEAKELTEEPVKLKRARSSILELLAVQKSDSLITDDGKQVLKKSILERASKALGIKVLDVFFSEFVVQF
jgi:flagellar protein FliL